ncbi:hypothetical protein ASG43_21670 [Aureimonas sp. Leaf454]|uniref:hypothetical protein n=1 Tax=Aureimonas sp. Leaf454 TaxID=1736381 RepID=UPI0006FFACA3|nr:hypothetical protein [Aureimonas sp. Leaf454]KQT50287.1 hypothetical protein ASG43_21670 [Aureimonas sp. Leaf454]
MQQAESDNTVSQIMNWYLVQVESGSYRDNGPADDKSELKIQWSMFTRYMSKEFRSRPFKDLDALDMQIVIDDAAASGSERAASRLRDIFANVDKFAVQRGVISKPRTKRLLSPVVSVEPRELSDAAFKSAWGALSLCAHGGAVVDRAPCLAIMTSGVTLQPLGNIISMRRSEVNFERSLWTSGERPRYVHLSKLALDLVAKAIDLGDFTHREMKTEFVFPSGGPKRDPARPVGYSLTYEVVRSFVDKAATPHDLRQTGIVSLQSLGGEELRSMVSVLSSGGLETAPDAMQTALIDGWAKRVQTLTQNSGI